MKVVPVFATSKNASPSRTMVRCFLPKSEEYWIELFVFSQTVVPSGSVSFLICSARATILDGADLPRVVDRQAPADRHARQELTRPPYSDRKKLTFQQDSHALRAAWRASLRARRSRCRSYATSGSGIDTANRTPVRTFRGYAVQR